MILLISFIHYYCIAFWDLVITVEVQVVYIQGFLLLLDPRAF